MQNIENSQDYDNYLKKYIHKYVVTKFLGRGQYEKTWFFTLEEAQKFHRIMKEIDANARVAIYGISKPPHTILEVNVLMENL